MFNRQQHVHMYMLQEISVVLLQHSAGWKNRKEISSNQFARFSEKVDFTEVLLEISDANNSLFPLCVCRPQCGEMKNFVSLEKYFVKSIYF